MTRQHPWRRLSRGDWRAIAVVFAAQVALGIAVRVISVPALSRVIAALRAACGRAIHVPEDRVAWAIEAVGRRLPGLSTCLVRALAADLFLSAPGRVGHVRVGVRRSAEGALESHAWFERDGRILVGASGSATYEPFTTLDISRPHRS